VSPKYSVGFRYVTPHPTPVGDRGPDDLSLAGGRSRRIKAHVNFNIERFTRTRGDVRDRHDRELYDRIRRAAAIFTRANFFATLINSKFRSGFFRFYENRANKHKYVTLVPLFGRRSGERNAIAFLGSYFYA